MGRRRIGQEYFRFGSERGESRSSSLTELAGLVDWAPIEKALADIHSAAKGEPAWPPLALFKAMLIAVWYDLSDVKLAEALDAAPHSGGFAVLPCRSRRRSGAPLFGCERNW